LYPMKHLLLILLLAVGAALPAAAQVQSASALNLMSYDYTRRWRFGFSLGINVFDYTVINSMKPVMNPVPPLKISYDALLESNNIEAPILWADVVTPQVGFNINGIVDYRLSRYFNLRALPGICFGTRELSFYDNSQPNDSNPYTMTLESNYIEIPILLKFSAKRVTNYRPYLVGGVNPRFNLNWKTSEKKGNYISTTVFEPFLEVGAGLDIYFYFFKLSVEFKYSGTFINSLGSNVVMGQEAYRDGIDRLNSQIFVFAIHIE